ncbi:uncharacterized protein LOC122266614 isoform X1 [Penaeus japonicus]|uniref:uncharacterized protein LOC122266614 isoform X1 n=1 Tax=Penaeus japonicus TaxID=27405 RepID=UPI001C711257|nr:uncharacterized protein LOC122266614 isoform X1 [Penaeus japonicus]
MQDSADDSVADIGNDSPCAHGYHGCAVHPGVSFGATHPDIPAGGRLLRHSEGAVAPVSAGAVPPLRAHRRRLRRGRPGGDLHLDELQGDGRGADDLLAHLVRNGQLLGLQDLPSQLPEPSLRAQQLVFEDAVPVRGGSAAVRVRHPRLHIPAGDLPRLRPEVLHSVRRHLQVSAGSQGHEDAAHGRLGLGREEESRSGRRNTRARQGEGLSRRGARESATPWRRPGRRRIAWRKRVC